MHSEEVKASLVVPRGRTTVQFEPHPEPSLEDKMDH
jgi:hypothetical protein